MKTAYVELIGNKYPLCFSLSAVEGMCEAFGSLEDMEAAFASDDVGTVVEAIDTALSVLMASGRKYAIATGAEVPPPLPYGVSPADLIPAGDKTAMQAIFAAMERDSARSIEVEPDAKNGDATQEA